MFTITKMSNTRWVSSNGYSIVAVGDEYYIYDFHIMEVTPIAKLETFSLAKTFIKTRYALEGGK